MIKKKEKAQESRNEGELPQLEKGHLQKSMGNIIFNDENKQTKTECFPLKAQEGRQGTSVCTTFIQYLTRGYNQSKKTHNQKYPDSKRKY